MMHRRKRFLFTGLPLAIAGALLMVALATMHVVAAQPVFGTNLIVNGDAESGAGDTSFPADIPVSVPGWTQFAGFTAVDYTIGSGYPTPSDPGPAIRGNNFLTGGQVTPSTGSQSIDVSIGAATIDSGVVTYDLSGFLGGFDTQDDNAVLTATFRDGAAASLGSASIGPVTRGDRGDATGLLLRSTSGNVPPNTRTIDILLTFTRLQGLDNDGYADNLSLILTAPTISVWIDIKPGSDPNSVNCNNENENIAVAILTTADFDATTVDHTTVAFEGANETHINKKTGVARRHEEDVDGDGDTDLVLHFRLGGTSLDCSSTEGTLTGETFGGQAIEGTDAVRMVDNSP